MGRFQYFICRLISPLKTVSQARSLIAAAHEYDESQQHYGDLRKSWDLSPKPDLK